MYIKIFVLSLSLPLSLSLSLSLFKIILICLFTSNEISVKANSPKAKDNGKSFL